MTNDQINDLCAQVWAAAFAAACRDGELRHASEMADSSVEFFKKKFDLR